MIPQERNEKSLKPWKNPEFQALAQQERFARGAPVPRHAPQGRFLALLAPCSNLPSQKNTTLSGGVLFVMAYHCRFLNPRLKNAMCKSEFSVLF